MSNSTMDEAPKKPVVPGLEWEEATPFEEAGSENATFDGDPDSEVLAAQSVARDFFEEHTNHEADEAIGFPFEDKTSPEMANPAAGGLVIVPDPPKELTGDLGLVEDDEEPAPSPVVASVPPAAPALPAPPTAPAARAASQVSRPAKPAEEPEEPPVLLDARKLDQVSALVVFFDLANAKETGTLTVKSKGQVVEVTFNDGAVTNVKTEADDLSLSAFLVKRNVCGKDAVTAAEAKKHEFGGDLGSALIAAGALPPHVFLENVVEWSRSVLEAVFNWTMGSAQFGRRKRVKPPAVPLGFERFRLLSETVRRGLSRATIDKRFPDKGVVPLPGHRSDGLGLDELIQDPKELRILKGVNGNTPLEDMLKEGLNKRDPLPLLRLMYYAAELGLIGFLDNPKEEIYAKQTAEYEALVAKFEQANYFDMLEVNDKTKDEEVTKAYHRKIKTHHPDALPNDIPAELAAAHMRLYGLYQQAYEALSTQEKRDSYRVVVDEGYRDEASAVKGIIKSRLGIKKAKVVARLHKYGEAMKFIQEALDLKPSDEYLQIYQLYYTFMMEGGRDPGRAEETALQILQLVPKGPAIHEDPKNKAEEVSKLADAHLFLMRLYKILGETDNTQKHCQEVLKHDPRNAEAEAEARAERMRQERQESQAKSSLAPSAGGRALSSIGRPSGAPARGDSGAAKGEKEAPPGRGGSGAGKQAPPKAGGKQAPERATSGIGSLFQKLVKKD